LTGSSGATGMPLLKGTRCCASAAPDTANAQAASQALRVQDLRVLI
jgi:hypothetical protein